MVRVIHNVEKWRNEQLAKSSKKPRGKFPLFKNPFYGLLVQYHHVNNVVTIPLPIRIHTGYHGKNHKEMCKKWIEKMYCIDVDDLFEA